MRSKKQETTIFMLFISAFSMAILVLLIYTITANTLTREITNAYHVSLLHTRDRMESYLRQLDRATLQFEKNPELERLLEHGTNHTMDQLSILSLMTILQRIHAASEHIDNVVLYDARNKKLYATNPAMNRVFNNYRSIITIFESSLEQRAFLNIEHNQIPVTVYIRKVPAFNRVQPLYMFFHINQRMYDEILAEDRYSENGTYFILDKDGVPLATRGYDGINELELLLPEINQQKKLISETGIASFITNTKFTAFLPPSFNGWIYGFFIPVKMFMNTLLTLRNIILTIAVGMFITSVLLSLLSSHWLWKGWKKITTILDENQDSSAFGHSDEFDIILSKIRTVVDTSAQLQIQMNTLMPTIKESFLLYLIDTGIRTKEDREKAEELGIYFPEGFFACFCTEIDYQSNSCVYSEKDIAVLEYAVKAVLQETLNKYGTGYIVKTDTSQFTVIFYSDLKDRDSFEKNLFLLAESVQNFINGYFPIDANTGISRIRTSYNHLNIAYRECHELLQNKHIYGAGKIFSYKNNENLCLPGMSLIHEMECEILYGIRIKDNKYAEQALEKIKNICTVPSVHYTWIQTRLIECAQNIFRQCNKQLIESQKQKEPSLEAFIDLASLDDWKNWFRTACISPLIEAIILSQREQAKETTIHIQEYIRKHLEEDIRLESCSTALGISNHCLKNALKDYLQCSFIDLVLKERIGQAKEWLKSTDMCVETIAQRLQYSNAQNFTRTFKRFTGLPPGQFRLESNRNTQFYKSS